MLRLQRTAGNAAVARLVQRSAPAAVQRVTIAGEAKSDIFLAVRVGGDRYAEKLAIIKSLGDADFESIDKLKEHVLSLLPESGVFLNGKAVSIKGVGQRYNAHISLDASIAYIRQFLSEITEGESQSLKVGEGRKSGYGVNGQLLYNFDGSTISIYHAHDSGRMG